MPTRPKADKRRSKRRIPPKAGLIIALIVIAAIILIADPEGFMGSVSSTPLPSANAHAPGAATPLPGGAKPSFDRTAGALEVYFLDVGQGDCIFLRSPNGKTMLVDSGIASAYATVDAFLKDQGVRALDVAVATHPHDDHIGAMASVIRGYVPKLFYLPDCPHTTSTYENMLSALEDCSITVKRASASLDATIAWDKDVTVRILSPFDEAKYDDLNDNSVILRVEYGATSVILTGDAGTYAESYMLANLPANYFDATVLKLGHHGSSTATSKAFFDAVSPEIAILSLGAGNTYGHPHKETLALLDESGIDYYRTDLNGTILVTLDGTDASVTLERAG